MNSCKISRRFLRSDLESLPLVRLSGPSQSMLAIWNIVRVPSLAAKKNLVEGKEVGALDWK